MFLFLTYNKPVIKIVRYRIIFLVLVLVKNIFLILIDPHTLPKLKLNVITCAMCPPVDNVEPRGNTCYNCSKILNDREYCCSSCKSVYFFGKNCHITLEGP